ncbi:unnamed protein product [Camellia sinensis]
MLVQTNIYKSLELGLGHTLGKRPREKNMRVWSKQASRALYSIVATSPSSFASSSSSSSCSLIARALTTWRRSHPLIQSPHHAFGAVLECPWSATQLRGAKFRGSDVKPGNVIERKGKIYQVVKAQHTVQGRGGACIQVELRDIDSGNKINERLRTDEAIEKVFVEEKPYTYLYTEDNFVVLAEPKTYDQLDVPKDLFGEAAVYLKGCRHCATDSSTSNASPSELFSVIFFDEDISFPQTKPYPIFCTAGISGGHINPAVTFGLFLARKVSLIRAVMYMVAQCLGAICGVALVKAFQSSYYDVYGGGANELSTGYSKGTGLGAEIIGTFVLVYTVFSATDPKRSARDSTHQTQSFLSSWNISTSHCTWSGVPCDAFRHVSSLNLSPPLVADMSSNLKVHSFEEVANHNHKQDCWIIISGKVYDVTSFLDNHPGGNEVLLTATGKDAPDDFED